MSEKRLDKNNIEKEDQLSAFQEEIKIFKEEEKNSGRTAHLTSEGFNEDDLNEEDMEIWRAVKEGSITYEQLEVYRKGIFSEMGLKPVLIPGVPRSRAHFAALIANKALPILIENDLKNNS